MTIAPAAGIGLKPQHYAEAISDPAAGAWFEIHPENYMCDGGPRHAALAMVRDRHPLSFHGVGLSLAGDEALDETHLARLRRLVDRYEPFLVSEHLAWSRRAGAYRPDLLPFPRTHVALARIARNIDRTQEVLGRHILIENPSLYLALEGHDYSEVDFLADLCSRTGCGLVLDVNNVHVSANNLGYSADVYLDAIPGSLIGELHLAGHAPDPSVGEGLLIDTHGAPVDQLVWRLYRRLINRIGLRPTLIERDDNIPIYADLAAERDAAAAILSPCTGGRRCSRMRNIPSSTHSTLRSQATWPPSLPGCKQPAFGLGVYRNTIASAAIDALAATFATVLLMVGEEWFRAAAREFARAHPPTDPALIGYGADFPQWLADFPPAADAPYLGRHRAPRLAVVAVLVSRGRSAA